MIATIVLAGLFFGLARFVTSGETSDFDRWVILSLRDPGDTADPLGPAWFESAVRDITALGSGAITTLIVIMIAGFLLFTGKRQTALFLVLAVSGGAILNSLLKIGFQRPRPDIVAHGVDVTSASFPSGHSMTSAVVYLTLGLLIAKSQDNTRVKKYVFSISIFLTLIVGLSRIYLGVHWPTDVMAGWTLGLLWALLCWALMLRLQQSGRIEKSENPA